MKKLTQTKDLSLRQTQKKAGISKPLLLHNSETSNPAHVRREIEED